MFAAALVILSGVLVALPGEAQAANVSALRELGKRVFFDPISRPRGRQSCASCHDPGAGWAGPRSLINLTVVAQPGAAFHLDRTAIGSLKPPSNAYASFIPPFSDDCGLNLGPPPTRNFCGGNFWNGRAEGSGALGLPPLYPGATEPIFGEDVFVVNGVLDADLKSSYDPFLGPTSEQALNPFPNPVEQNIDRQSVCKHVQKSAYAYLYRRAWKEPIRCDDATAYNKAFKRIAVALGAWQASPEVNSFSSKRDKALRAELDCLAAELSGIPSRASDCQHPNYLNSPGTFPLVGLTTLENYGHDLFYADRLPFTPVPPIPVGTVTACDPAGTAVDKGSNCSFCHSDDPAADDGAELLQLYTDNHYHNIGMPPNPEIPNNPGANPGLAGHTSLDGEDLDGDGVADERNQFGFFKTPTLRNVDKRPHSRFIKAYGHNGWFKSIESIVHFYNTAFVDNPANGKTRCPDGYTERQALAENCWPAPESAGAPIPALVGNLGLSACDESAIVAYLKTLTDRKVVLRPLF
jgi:cytochrome c peroxidase